MAPRGACGRCVKILKDFLMQDILPFLSVEPVQPPASYIGGKKQLGRRLAAIIEQIPHDLYAEAFVGMGGVFFRRTRVPRAEVINDISGDVTTLFRILQRHYPQFIETLKFQITSRREFERLASSDPATLTDLERAARFIYLQRLAFGGKVAGRSFGVNGHGGARFNVTRLATTLEDVHERLAGVVIENLALAGSAAAL
jgi:DNA adenine methylase